MQTIPTALSRSGLPAAVHGSERRGPQRVAVLIPAIAVCANGVEYRCVLRDISLGGAKIGIPRRYRLPVRFKLVTGGRPYGFPMRLAWQCGDFAGLTLDIVPDDPAANA